MVFIQPDNPMPNVDLVYQHALDRLGAVGFAALSERERDLATLWHVEAEVTNGGFLHYFSGAAGATAYHAPDALARVGALEKSGIVRAANALFGPAGPPRDRKERLAAIKALSARDLATIDDLEKRYYNDPVDVDELVEDAASKMG